MKIRREAKKRKYAPNPTQGQIFFRQVCCKLGEKAKIAKRWLQSGLIPLCLKPLLKTILDAQNYVVIAKAICIWQQHITNTLLKQIGSGNCFVTEEENVKLEI